VVHLPDSGINALLLSSVAQIHPGNNRILAGTYPQRQRTDNKLRQNAVPFHTRDCVLGKAQHAVSASTLRQLADHDKSAPTRSSPPRVRHCHRRSRESDAQHPLPQPSVTARRVSRAEHVTPAFATDAILQLLRNEAFPLLHRERPLSRAASISRYQREQQRMPPARAAVRPRNSPDRINARPAARDGNKAGARSCRECRMCDSSSEV